ncbi:MAG: sensor domain-containing phosphodiesterase [Solirubrobacteraceae bacterium]
MTTAAEALRVQPERLIANAPAGMADAVRRLADAQALAQLGSFEWLPVCDSVLISDEVFRLFGLRPGSVPGTLAAWEPRLHPDDLDGLMRAMATTLAEGSVQTFEFRFKPATGGFRWAEGRLQAERRGSRAVRLLGTIQDIHERKASEDRLRGEVEELEEVAQIRAAMCSGRLTLHAQEIIDLGTGGTVMSELLVRLIDREGVVIPAGEFICLAERHGMIDHIDRWVLEQAVELAATGMPVALNVSAQTMSDAGYSANVVRLLDQRQVDPTLLTFEITETALVENFEQARRFAGLLEALGCPLALDDFGTGYGSFTYLKELPAHFLKIDREFVRDLIANPRSRAVIKGIVGLADSFGQQTIAEGVEDGATLEVLRELGVDFAQGYFIGRPRPLTAGREAPLAA